MQSTSSNKEKKYDIVLISIQRDSLSTNSRKKDGLNRLPPLGLMYLGSYLNKMGFKTKILDIPVNRLDEIINFVKKSITRILGFSITTSTFKITKRFLEENKQVFSNNIIILGGVHASSMPETCFKEIEKMDFLVYGEGEKILYNLLKELNKINCEKKDLHKIKKELNSINGLCYRINDKININKKPNLIENLDDIPFPKRDRLSKYIPPPNQYKKLPVAHIMASRGCSYNCSYCLIGSMYSSTRYRSVENVIKEINYLLGLGVKEIHIWDDCFTSNYLWVKKFCERIIKENIKFSWSCFSRVDTIDEKLLRLIKSAGCWCIFYGIESANKDQLKLINKNICLKRAEDIIKITKNLGICTRVSFMLGLPGENIKKAKKTINFAIKLNPDYIQFCYTTPFPGTQLYKNYHKYGTLESNFSNYSLWDPVFIPFGYKTKKDLIKIKKYAFRRFYLRPSYILNQLKSIKSYEDFIRFVKGCFFLINYL